MSMTDSETTPWRVAALALLGAVLLVALAGVVSPRASILALSVFALAGAAARVFTPLRKAFVVRSRPVDVSVLLVLGAALAYLGLTTQLG